MKPILLERAIEPGLAHIGYKDVCPLREISVYRNYDKSTWYIALWFKIGDLGVSDLIEITDKEAYDAKCTDAFYILLSQKFLFQQSQIILEIEGL